MRRAIIGLAILILAGAGGPAGAQSALDRLLDGRGQLADSGNCAYRCQSRYGTCTANCRTTSCRSSCSSRYSSCLTNCTTRN